MNKQQIISTMVNMPRDSIVIASGAMVLLDLWEKTNDLDLAVTNEGYVKLSNQKGAVFATKRFGPNVTIGDIEASPIDQYGLWLQWTTVNDVLVQTPTSILELYLSMNRPKDQEKIKILKDHLPMLRR